MASRAKKKRKAAPRKRSKGNTAATSRRCGLCGGTKRLTKTECCGRWICDDVHEYRLFSYARNSCFRNHRRFTLCGYHFAEQHAGDWKDCAACRDQIAAEMYVYYGTNEYNFEVLENPPDYEPTRCIKCGTVIPLADGGYIYSHDGYLCGRCSRAEHPGYPI